MALSLARNGHRCDAPRARSVDRRWHEEIARWNPGPAVPDAAAEFMAERNDRSDASHASWAVADASDRLVGSVSVHQIDADQADAEIGYWVAPWGRRLGHATRAVVAASRFAFTRLGLHRIYLYHAVENTGSCGRIRPWGSFDQ